MLLYFSLIYLIYLEFSGMHCDKWLQFSFFSLLLYIFPNHFPFLPFFPIPPSFFLFFFFSQSQNLSCYFFYAGLKLNILLPQFPKDYKSAYNEETILDFSNYLLLHAKISVNGWVHI